MISKKLTKSLCEQIKWEIASANLYLAMSAYFDNMGLSGFSNWMRVQYREETDHALKIYDYLLSCGSEVTMLEIPAPECGWKTPLEVFKAAAKHEAFVTKLINGLVAIAKGDKDYGSDIFLQWFVTEQIEEEEADKTIIDRLTLLKDDGAGLLAMDRELAARQYVPIAPQA